MEGIMPQEEIYGKRDRTYSDWHRRNSTRRYIGIEKAQLLTMIDLDASVYVEYDDGTKEPLALIETAMDNGQSFKSATVTLKLAQRANLPCFVLLYKKTASIPPDIERFRAKRLHPKIEKEWRILTPEEWCKTLLALRKWQCSKLDQEWETQTAVPP